MEAIGLSESHLAASSFDLVMADHSSPLLSIGNRTLLSDTAIKVLASLLCSAQRLGEC